MTWAELQPMAFVHLCTACHSSLTQIIPIFACAPWELPLGMRIFPSATVSDVQISKAKWVWLFQFCSSLLVIHRDKQKKSQTPLIFFRQVKQHGFEHWPYFSLKRGSWLPSAISTNCCLCNSIICVLKLMPAGMVKILISSFCCLACWSSLFPIHPRGRASGCLFYAKPRPKSRCSSLLLGDPAVGDLSCCTTPQGLKKWRC